jgi:hypothetical protein
MSMCPECGSIAPDSFGECPTCGASLSIDAAATPVTCDHCGERIASDADACPACGELREDRQCSTHGDRAASGQCVVCGLAVCDGCNHGGDAHYLCETHCDIPVVAGWAQIYTTSDDLEAHLIRENLEAEGVDARILSQKDHFSIPVDLGDLSPVRVLVPAYAYQDAERVLAEHRDASGDVAFGDGEEPVTG